MNHVTPQSHQRTHQTASGFITTCVVSRLSASSRKSEQKSCLCSISLYSRGPDQEHGSTVTDLIPQSVSRRPETSQALHRCIREENEPQFTNGQFTVVFTVTLTLFSPSELIRSVVPEVVRRLWFTGWTTCPSFQQSHNE